jgi:phosphohistidine phosphatase SixA
MLKPGTADMEALGKQRSFKNHKSKPSLQAHNLVTALTEILSRTVFKLLLLGHEPVESIFSTFSSHSFTKRFMRFRKIAKSDS